MVNQHAISVKLNYDVLDELEKEAYVSGLPKNRIINCAITEYTKLMDAKRQVRAYGFSDVSNEIIEQFVRRLFPGHTIRIDS